MSVEKNSKPLKTPILRDVQGVIINSENIQTEKVNQPTTNKIGIATTVLYYITFIYIYGSAYAHCDTKGIFRNINFYTSPKCTNKIGWSSKKASTFKSFTLSYSFLYSEKVGTIILLFITMGLMFSLLIEQKFADDKETLRSAVLAGPFMLAAAFVSFLIMGPEEYKNTHYIFAFVVLLAGLIFTISVDEIYQRYYDQMDNIHNLMITLCVLTGCFIASFLLKSYNNFYGDNLLAMSEFINVITFGLVLYELSILPPLPVNNTCIATM